MPEFAKLWKIANWNNKQSVRVASGLWNANIKLYVSQTNRNLVVLFAVQFKKKSNGRFMT